ncbi:Tegument protein UL51 [Eptesicus fuscus gammaherpesvirus]|uniref:Tegument protein UL51 n=1 Tax=vespertilionid gammaherpesvirus 3 TaxID=2846598 RepID=A0A2D0ZPL3_9GAMA|nr:Tegument protein UL51 [Eptesicus fuscus gammaherpesvirus]ATA58286.1 Tegument protein UL51 [Eptesicus fuscus gammaherpesvirus]WAH70921.1 putative tegument protein UL51 [Eptesicus fuscus gammaherpesvirus]
MAGFRSRRRTSAWTCCGFWPFGSSRSARDVRSYHRLDTDGEELDWSQRPHSAQQRAARMEVEIEMGLPPGVTLADVLRSRNGEAVLHQAYLLAVQSNQISDYLRRFDAARVPDSCRAVVNAQVAKLRSVQSVIWNAMISLAVGGITIEDASLQALLDKQAGETLALVEMEKLATAIKMDDSQNWATDIERLLHPLAVPTQLSPETAPDSYEPVVTHPPPPARPAPPKPPRARKTISEASQV